MQNKRLFMTRMDFTAVNEPPIFLGTVKQLDGVTLKITPLSGRTPMTMIGVTPKLYAKKPNGEFVYQDVDIDVDLSTSQISIQCKNFMFSDVGTVEMEIELYDDDNYLITSPTFEIDVTQKLNQLEMEDLKKGVHISLLEELIDYVEESTDYVERFKKLLSEFGDDDTIMLENLIVVRMMLETLSSEVDRLENTIAQAQEYEFEMVNQETARVAAEEKRVEVEADRVQAENDRKEAESQREENEANRENNFNDIKEEFEAISNTIINANNKVDEAISKIPPKSELIGPKGDKGEQGIQGISGITPNISIGSVNTLEPGQNATVTRRGTDANPIFDFGIPKGETGSVFAPTNGVEPREDDVPKLFLTGVLPTTKDSVNMQFEYISSTDRFNGYVDIKCQGTSSMSYAKKNFTIKLYKDKELDNKIKKDFKGWGAQNKFCLKANYVDTTHTRNVGCARIAKDIVDSRPDSEFKRNLQKAPRNGLIDGFPIRLYHNGDFYGIYTWNIPKDGWMFGMDEDNPNHIVLCGERNTDGNANLINSCQFRKLWTDGDGGDWSVEFGTYNDNVKNSFNRCIEFVMNATDDEFRENIGQYFDLDSLIDYYCFSYFCNHNDGLAKNMLMVTYDGVVWGASLYDMDTTFGAWYTGASFVSAQYKCPEDYQERFSRLWARLEECFAIKISKRYFELRNGALSLGNVVSHIEGIYDLLSDRTLNEEKAKWTSLPSIATNTMLRFRRYMQDRANYVDACMEELGVVKDLSVTDLTLNKNKLELSIPNKSRELITEYSGNLIDASMFKLGMLNYNTGLVTDSTEEFVSDLITINNNTCDFIYQNINGELFTYLKAVVYDKDMNVLAKFGDSPVSYINVETNLANYSDAKYIRLGAYSGSGVLKNPANLSLTYKITPVTSSITLNSENASELTIPSWYTPGICVEIPIDIPVASIKCKTHDIEVVSFSEIYQTNTHIPFRVAVNKFMNNVYLNVTLPSDVKTLQDAKDWISNNPMKFIFNEIIEEVIETTYVPGYLARNSASVANGTAGEVKDSTQDISTDFIEIDENCISFNIKNTDAFYVGAVMYDENKKYLYAYDPKDNIYLLGGIINDYSLSEWDIVNIPSNVKYVRMCFQTTNEQIVTIKKFSKVSSEPAIKPSSQTLVATITPSNAENKNVVWSVDNNNVTITPNGLTCVVNAQNTGSAIVTCTSSDERNGIISDVCNITVL